MSVNEEMDLAAAKAHQDLLGMVHVGHVSKESMRSTAAWIKRWYMQAGYKRLAKIIVEQNETPERNET